MNIMTRTAIVATAIFSFAQHGYSEGAKPAYPLTTCVVSGEALGEMGDPFIYNYKGQEVQLCCKKCLKKFQRDPEKYMAILKDAGGDAAKKESQDHAHHADN